MNKRTIYPVLIIFIIFLFIFLFSGELLFLFLCLGALGVALSITLMIKNYDPRIYNLVPLPFLVFQGLILVYIYLFRFKSLQDQSYVFLFYFFAVIWIVIVPLYIYYSWKLFKKDHRKQEVKFYQISFMSIGFSHINC